MRVAIVGSRNCKNLTPAHIARFLPEACTEIISGGARGIDLCAEILAARKQIRFLKFEPDYAEYGRIAPLMRNTQIILRANLVLAFWDFHSTGTANTIAQCIEKHIPVKIIGLDDCD